MLCFLANASKRLHVDPTIVPLDAADVSGTVVNTGAPISFEDVPSVYFSTNMQQHHSMQQQPVQQGLGPPTHTNTNARLTQRDDPSAANAKTCDRSHLFSSFFTDSISHFSHVGTEEFV